MLSLNCFGLASIAVFVIVDVECVFSCLEQVPVWLHQRWGLCGARECGVPQRRERMAPAVARGCDPCLRDSAARTCRQLSSAGRTGWLSCLGLHRCHWTHAQLHRLLAATSVRSTCAAAHGVSLLRTHALAGWAAGGRRQPHWRGHTLLRQCTGAGLTRHIVQSTGWASIYRALSPSAPDVVGL
jgi:hypothetical protein